MSVFSIKKLSTGEDDELQKALAKLDRTEALAQDIVLGGAAVPVDERAGARIDEALDELATTAVPETWADDDAVVPAYRERVDWAYLLGLAVGVRVAKVNGGCAMTSKTRKPLTPEQLAATTGRTAMTVRRRVPQRTADLNGARGGNPRTPVLVGPPQALVLVSPEEEHRLLLAAIKNLGSEQRATLWFLAEHPAVLDLVDRILSIVPQEIEK